MDVVSPTLSHHQQQHLISPTSIIPPPPSPPHQHQHITQSQPQSQPSHTLPNSNLITSQRRKGRPSHPLDRLRSEITTAVEIDHVTDVQLLHFVNRRLFEFGVKQTCSRATLLRRLKDWGVSRAHRRVTPHQHQHQQAQSSATTSSSLSQSQSLTQLRLRVRGSEEQSSDGEEGVVGRRNRNGEEIRKVTAVPRAKRKRSARMDYAAIETPAACYADFCLIPIGTGSVSVAKEIAEVQRLLKASKEVKYTMHSAGTTVEGSWDDVMRVIGRAHAVVHKMGAVRVQSSMRVGTRTDKTQTAVEKVTRVENLLAETTKS